MVADEQLFFKLIQFGLGTYKADGNNSIGFSSYDKLYPNPRWEDIFKMGVQQGVAAVQFQGLECICESPILHKDDLPNRQLKLTWFAYANQVEKRCEQQLMIASELANIYAKHKIRTVVLKGIAVGIDYPQPNYRPCGDLDCFLLGDYKRGNEIAKESGASVDDHSYKHSHIEYKGLTIENHQFCTPISGSKRTKRLECLLRTLLMDDGTTMIGDTHLECPSPMFNALFLTHHAQRHFLMKEIALRHLCDWAMLIHKHGNEIDWVKFKDYCEGYGMNRFSESMTRLSDKLLNVKVPTKYIIPNDNEADEYLFNEILYGRKGSSSNTLWKQHLGVIKNIFDNRKRYKMFSDESYLQNIFQLVYGFCFDRNPHL